MFSKVPTWFFFFLAPLRLHHLVCFFGHSWPFVFWRWRHPLLWFLLVLSWKSWKCKAEWMNHLWVIFEESSDIKMWFWGKMMLRNYFFNVLDCSSFTDCCWVDFSSLIYMLSWIFVFDDFSETIFAFFFLMFLRVIYSLLEIMLSMFLLLYIHFGFDRFFQDIFFSPSCLFSFFFFFFFFGSQIMG